MTIINCPECKNGVSDKASFCPSCGYPLNSIAIGNSIVNMNAMECPYFPHGEWTLVNS
ncbi:MAG: zinc ribbon domain-containing protein [Syntrophomonadaceae bacterium]|jgi:predicted amidophosphoribosyltransferase|nr:zinc ribbon domain-containing protein [Syntrophomonadaceae bacterium]